MISFKNVNKWFGDLHVLRNIDLEVERGEVVVVCGPSGSGKSTLLNMIGGLTDVTKGRVWVGDEEVTTMSPRERARMRLDHIGFVFQAYNLLPVLTALENAEFTLLLRGMPAEERHRRVHALFEEIGAP